MEISVSWDSAPVRQQFGAFNIVADGVATLADGRRFRVNASASRAARKPAVTLRYMTEAKRGAEVREGALSEVRAAALASFAELIAPLRAEFIAKARAADAEFMAERAARNDEFAAELEAPASDASDAEESAIMAARNDEFAAELEAPEVTSPRVAFVVALCGGRRAFLCEGGVYSSAPRGEYSDNTLERAERDAAEYNRRYDSRYEVRHSLEGVTVESEVRASLEGWQRAIIDAKPAAQPATASAPVLVANTTRACYWRLADGSFIATGADVTPSASAGGYARLDAIMTLKGETGETIRRVAALNVAAPAKLARVASRTIDGTEWLGVGGWCGDIRAAFILSLADAEEIARRETDKERQRKPREGEEPGEGRYSIVARPYDAPALYTLADYEADAEEAARLDSLYGEGAE